MSKFWKEDLIRTRYDAELFVERWVASLGLAASIVLSTDRSGFLNLWVRDTNIKPPKKNTIMTSSGAVYGDELHIDTFVVAPGLRGKDLSLILLKALIGIACSYANPLKGIWLNSVQESGPRFWASLGGLVPRPVVHDHFGAGSDNGRGTSWLQTTEEQLLDGAAEHSAWKQAQEAVAKMSTTDRTKLAGIGRMGENYPLLAYRELAQVPFHSEQKSSLDFVCDGLLMVESARAASKIHINLQEQSALKIMRDKLGVLPLCPIPRESDQSRYHPIALETARRHNDTRFLRQYDEFRRARLNL